jgi:hypothetical protein
LLAPSAEFVTTSATALERHAHQPVKARGECGMGVLTFRPHMTVTHDESTRAVMGYWAGATKELESGAQLPQDSRGHDGGPTGVFRT